MMAWRQIIFKARAISISQLPHPIPRFSRFFSKASLCAEKVGIPEFLNGIGKRVESHMAKLESEIGVV
ncbi:hypothetical protein I3760_14G114600 [Carya illinoinensis]|nr:hypothetical protein I3760_14G114600 [Carya illinoinensis]